jgi:hypothetical protein
MSCAFPKETLALHIEGDLTPAGAEITSSHLAACDECRHFVEQLCERQSLLKSLRLETVASSDCTGMRRDVMALINDRRAGAGWAWRIERAFVLGFQRHSYAMAAITLICLASAAVLAQIRSSPPETKASVPAFEGRDTLLRPEGYRDWMLMGGPARSQRTAVELVFMNPTAYREYAKTGKFPEGTLMIWEAVRDTQQATAPHKQSSLLASVKDRSRFDGGWGFFDFTGLDGTVATKAKALPESSGCRTCHRQDAT